VAFFGWVAVSTVFSVHSPTALIGQYRRFEGLATHATYVGLFFLTLQVADSSSRVRDIARALAPSAMLISAYGLLQHVGLDPLKWGEIAHEAERSFSTFGNPDPLGGYLIMPMAVSLSLALSEQRGPWRLLATASFALSGVALLTTFTRGAWIGGVLALALVLVAAVRARVKPTKAEWAITGAAAAAAAAVFVRSLSSASPVTNIVERVASIFRFSEGSAVTRFMIWDAAMRAIRTRPLTGYGPDTFALVFPRFKSAAYSAAAGHANIADNAHNYPLHLAAGVGVPGALLLYGFWLLVLARSARTAFATERHASRLVMAGMWAAVAGYLVHLFFGISALGSTSLLWVLVALLLAPEARERAVPPPSGGRVLAVLLVALSAAAVALSATQVVADNAYARGFTAPDAAAAVAAYEQAVRFAPLNYRYRSQLAAGRRDLMDEAIARARALAAAGQDDAPALSAAAMYFRDAEKAAQVAIEHAPLVTENYTFLANLYIQAGVSLDPGFLVRAIETAQAGVRAAPNDADLRYQLAVAYSASGRFDEARSEAETAASIDPNWVDPVILLADLDVEQGRLESARERYVRSIAAVEAMPPGAFDPDRLARLRSRLASVQASLAAGGR
jgi:putative inorganic carbon (HCO3(-)) transporter